jgi:hypothetical protein
MTAPHHSDLHPCLGRSPSRRVCRGALTVTLLGALVACRAPSPRTAGPDRVPPPPAAHELGDASYDWHGLLIAPFGSVLKDIPVALHEVLLFRDDAHGNAAPGNAATGSAGADAAAVDAECYAADAPAPRFVGSIPDEYLLCFNQGRLSRIQASVRVPAAQASDVFAAACARWLKNAVPATSAGAPGVGEPGVGASGVGAPGVGTSGVAASGAGASGAVAPPAEAPSAGACEGRDGAIHFRGRLEEEPGRAETPQSESVLSITLDSAPHP